MTDEEHTERAALQRRIKNQRRALRILHRHAAMQAALIERYKAEAFMGRSNAYRDAARMAERFWFGERIARAIRRPSRFGDTFTVIGDDHGIIEIADNMEAARRRISKCSR